MYTSLFMPFVQDFLNDQEIIKEKNKQKQQEAIDMWHAAKKFPRKTKKKMRKVANYDYNFWVAMGNYHDSFFSI